MRKSASATCKAAGVLLISAREDEHPEIYRDIHATLEQQAELLEPIARFEPRLVHMARHGEPPED